MDANRTIFYVCVSILFIKGLYLADGLRHGSLLLQGDRRAYNQPLSPAIYKLSRDIRGLTGEDLGGRARPPPSSKSTTKTTPPPPANIKTTKAKDTIVSQTKSSVITTKNLKESKTGQEALKKFRQQLNKML